MEAKNYYETETNLIKFNEWIKQGFTEWIDSLNSSKKGSNKKGFCRKMNSENDQYWFDLFYKLFSELIYITNNS